MITIGAGFSNSPGAATCSPTTGATQGPTTWASVNANNQITSAGSGGPVATYTYDSAGNVTYDGTNFYAYDGEGRLCAVQPVAGSGAFGYLYDADGNRHENLARVLGDIDSLV